MPIAQVQRTTYNIRVIFTSSADIGICPGFGGWQIADLPVPVFYANTHVSGSHESHRSLYPRIPSLQVTCYLAISKRVVEPAQLPYRDVVQVRASTNIKLRRHAISWFQSLEKPVMCLKCICLSPDTIAIICNRANVNMQNPDSLYIEDEGSLTSGAVLPQATSGKLVHLDPKSLAALHIVSPMLSLFMLNVSRNE
jgi:hypothetical protein